MSIENRRYVKRRRAEAERKTQARIAEAAVALHGTVGPARTTISAVAERAGVRRTTVYRHFPDEAALLAACSSLWLSRNPFPDLARLGGIEDPGARVETALRELYAYYRSAEAMLANVLRDVDTVPALAPTLEGYADWLAALRGVLLQGLEPAGGPPLQAAVGHALAFTTWRSLCREQGLDDAAAGGLMRALIDTAALGRARS